MDYKGKLLMKKYELGRLLGQGNFAKVYLAKNIQTGHNVAVKVIDKEKVIRVGLMDQTKREISIMRLVKHPNVLQLYEVMATKTKIYFVIEYAKGGELFHKIEKGRLKEDVARKYFQQLINAVEFCHSRSVYHRDLKPENLLLDEDGNLKISDFGLSALADSKHQDGLLHTTCGTPAYVAPEVISRKGYDGAKSDVWSCGVILFVLLAGYLPFYDMNLIVMYRKIAKAEFKFPTWFSSEARRLITRILDPNPSTRITIQRIMEHTWVRKGRIINIKPSQINEVVTCEASNENNKEMVKMNSLNAFDFISLSSGFKLSGLFVMEKDEEKREARFTSTESVCTIMSKMEEMASNSSLKVEKKDERTILLEGSKEGRMGSLRIQAEIFDYSPSFHLVEMTTLNDDATEFDKILKHDIKPGLKEVVLAWQGEQQ